MSAPPNRGIPANRIMDKAVNGGAFHQQVDGLQNQLSQVRTQGVTFPYKARVLQVVCAWVLASRLGL